MLPTKKTGTIRFTTEINFYWTFSEVMVTENILAVVTLNEMLERSKSYIVVKLCLPSSVRLFWIGYYYENGRVWWKFRSCSTGCLSDFKKVSLELLVKRKWQISTLGHKCDELTAKQNVDTLNKSSLIALERNKQTGGREVHEQNHRKSARVIHKQSVAASGSLLRFSHKK